MDGTYGNVFPTSRAMSPSASTPSGSQYKVNVSRQKTKKWANFKPQNYDGDDWGDEYDDEPAPEPEPPLPAKPLGPRLPAGSSPTSRQFEPTSAAPPSRAHTHQFSVPPSGPSPTPGGPPRRITEPFGSSSHNLSGHTLQQFTPDARRGSPASQGGHQLPSQLPSRENSAGLDGVEDGLGGIRKTGASPQPSDGPKPWTEGRSASPSSAGLASPNKPLPLIRPADVYQRMAEEREREQQSRSAGRPAEGTADALSREPYGSEAQQHKGGTVAQPADLPGAEDNEIGRTLNYGAGLAPIAERQSEYGFDGFLASYGAEASAESPVAHGQDAEAQKSVQPVSHEDIRRYSTSPQLPNLSRMSGFGDDLFSSTSLFPASGLRSPLSGSMQLPTSGQSIPEGDESAAAAAEAPGQLATSPTPQGVTSSAAATGAASARADAGPSPPNEPDQDRPVGLSHQAAARPVLGASEQQTPAADAAREPASPTEKQVAPLAVRPQLPGGWVSETPSTPAELAASSPAGYSRETLDKAVKSRGALATISQSEVISSDVSSRRQSEIEPGVTSKADAAKERSASKSPHPASPRDPPPLSSPSPVPSLTKSDMGARQATPEGLNRNASPAPAALATKTGGPTPAHTEIAPTAPLNTRRGTPDSNGSSRPVLTSPFPTASAQDSSSHSPVKDSDLLSEEIIKSLSPPQTAGSFTDAAEGSTAAYQAAAADPMRESSYLGDVYGDYWSTAEDKAEPGLLKTLNAEKVADLPPLPAGLPEANVTTPAADSLDLSSPSTPSHATPAEDSNMEPKSALGHSGLKKQFSWEASPHGATSAADSGPEAVSPPETEPLVEQKALGSGVENVGRLASGASTPEAEPRPLSQAQEAQKSAEDLRAESAPEFNPAATLGSTLGLDRRVQSPSSSLDSTDRPGDDKRLSLAEEKIALQDSHPTLEHHPVFSGSQPARQDEPQAAPSAKNILGFRNIMELPLPTDRIKHYNETRWQFAAVDTGLDEWVQAMMSKHPEHANEVMSHPGVAPQPQQGGQGIGLGGRVPAHIHIPPSLQHGLSGLGHSSNQVGTKGKELFMAAGKAGKGLFSKGRNKLRGTGDKVFSG